MHPHLHVLLPSSAVDIALEARVFFPASAVHPALTTVASGAVTLDDIPHRAQLAQLGVRRVVTAAHPWARLGGNMDFPVLAHHLPTGVYGIDGTAEAGADVATVTFNARGVGKSGGSQPWPGFGIGDDGKDFAAVERAVMELTGATEAWRLGYSYGTNLALNAPDPPSLRRMMLVSPAPTLFKAMTALRGPTFQQGLELALDRAATASTSADGTCDTRSLWHVFGTADDFTGVETLRALGGERNSLIVPVEIEGGGHFYVRPQDGMALRAAIEEWISDK